MSTFLQAAQHRYEHAQAPQKFDIWQRVQALSSNAMRELHDFHDAMRRKVPALRCAECVSQALSAAEPRAAQLALQELPGINLSMVWSILWSIGKDIALYVGGGAALGGVVGGAAGAFAGFGAGAVPGAMVGASAGAEVGSWILGAIGIKCLIEYIGKAIPDMTHQFSKGFAHAWRAGELDPSRTMDIATEMHSATDAFAHGQLQLVIAILAAIVLYLSKGQLGKTRLFSELGKSKLGSQFANWVEANMDALMKHPKLRPVKKAAASKTPEPSSPSAKQGVPTPKEDTSAAEQNKTTTAHTTDSVDLAKRAAQVRNDLNVGAGRNIAVAQYSIDGQTGELVAISGQASRPGTVSAPEKQIFDTIKTGNNPRTLDAEYKILSDLATKLKPSSQGVVNLYSELPVCVSCNGVINQFQQRFPGVIVNVTTGKL